LPIPKDDGALVTGGIYRFVRHPIYSGVLLAALGALVWGASLPHVVGFVALWGVLLTKVMGEEKMLGEKYSGYSAYAKATGRFFPRLGR
jgi:protein-S-isoprenylcysteine O-methyltransferase Ste14